MIFDIKDKELLGIRGLKAGEDITIPEGVESVYPYAVASLNIGKLTLPSTLKHVDTQAFEKTYMRKLVLPEGVLTIGEGAFRDCGLKELILPDTLEIIGKSSFADNELKELVLPPNLKRVEPHTFSKNPLEKVTFAYDLDQYALSELALSFTKIVTYVIRGVEVRTFPVASGTIYVKDRELYSINGEKAPAVLQYAFNKVMKAPIEDLVGGLPSFETDRLSDTTLKSLAKLRLDRLGGLI